MSCPVDWSAWTPEIPATLLFIVADGRVLLIRKKRGIGAGKVNGPGGKIDPGETPVESAVREAREELHIEPLDPVKVGELWFAMSDLPDIHCHVFRATRFTGVPTETPEAVPLWTPVDAIPFDEMWEDDRHWLPELIAGRTFLSRFVFEGEKIVWMEQRLGVEWDGGGGGGA